MHIKKREGGLYDIYLIIDLDQQYVYYFTEGNDSDICEKSKIISGDLNTTLTNIQHEGAKTWNEKFYFKYKEMPYHLIYRDGKNFEWNFYTTNLEEALKIKDKKQIYEV